MEQQISISDTTAVVCECGSDVFQDALMLRKASRLLTGAAQDALIPVQGFMCAKCQTVVQEYLPPELRKSTISTESIV